MFLVLIGVGVALVIFGGVVLLRHSDKPGGAVKWLGMEMTSTGAGLPLIALGVASIAFAITNAPRTTTPGPAPLSTATTSTDACADSGVAGVAPDRVARVEVGMRDVQIVRRDQPQDAPFGLVLTENGQRVATLRMRRYGSGASAMFRIEAAVDAECRDVATLENVSRGGDPRAIQNWDTLRLRVGGRAYDLRIGGEGDINVGFLSAAA